MAVRIKFNEAGFRELLTSAGAQALVDEHAQRMASGANAVPSTTQPAHQGPYYEVENGSDGDRARRRVVTTDARAAAHEVKTHALLRQL